MLRYIYLACLFCLYKQAFCFQRAGLFTQKLQPTSTLSLLMSSSEGKAIGNVAFVLLAGGVGKRMQADRPKQFLSLQGKPILHHSLDLFLNKLQTGLPSDLGVNINSVVVVIDPSYRNQLLEDFADSPAIDLLTFADPGKERQDSVFNGLKAVPGGSDGVGDDSLTSLVAIHDSARPLVTVDAIASVLSDASKHGAAVLGVPMKATVKEAYVKGGEEEGLGPFVKQTVDRSKLWEVQTPQVVRPTLLFSGFRKVQEEGLEVTDDVSVVEHLGKDVKLTMGDYNNLKITTPEDMPLAEKVLAERQ